ncbi:MAG: hypothetical protein HY717_20370 [Planctomycetes bacterium]|nr:hypothetical protein [Planctomycetota bacterium]
MSPRRWSAILGLATILAIVPAARAQQFKPSAGYVYPAGGRQGAEFEVTIGGQYLDGVTDALVSGTGVKATVVEHAKPLPQGQAKPLREKLQELMKKGKDAEILKEIAEIRKKLAAFARTPPTPAIAETVTLKVTMAPGAEPGERELRLGTPMGLTNPLVFCVGQLAEFGETLSKPGNEPQSNTTDAELNVTLPATVNGRIVPRLAAKTPFPARQGQQFTPGDADRYRFRARQGQRLVAAARARELIPYLADAVPGWFQATMALYDAKGKELAYNDDYRFHPDPVIHYEIPEDGEYVIEIKDALYRGREDFVYRIALGELPFVTSIFPLGGQAGAQTTVELRGWNLPVDRLAMDAKDKGPGIYPLSVRRGNLVSNLVLFAVDTLPECLEKEPNDSRGNATRVTLPIIVNGRIDQPGDRDVLGFEGRAGDEIAAEVHARRLCSPLDSVLKLTDATGRQLAFNDDHEDKGSGLNTHHADSFLRATLPENGTYYLHLGDAQRKGGADHAYRLRISPPRPDFELRVVPSSISVRGGATVPLAVYALRKDGFSDEIALALKDAPKGFTLSGGQVPANQDQVRFTLTVPPTPLKEPLSLSLEGRATIQGREVSRPGVPADDRMQAFAYRHLVPAKELKVAVSRRNMSRASVKILGAIPVKIPAGRTARVQVGGLPSPFSGQVQLELNEPPDGIAIQEVSPSDQGMEIVLQSDAAKIKPGLKGNLIVNAFAARTLTPSGKGKAPGNRGRNPLGTLPAIPFEIVEP